MYQYAVSKSTVSTNPYLPLLLKEFEKLKSQRARLYFTYIEGDDDEPLGSKENPEHASFTFVTPSKQVHLGFGMMSWEGQVWLAWLLEHEFQNDKHMSQLILYTNDRENGTLVTRTEEIDGNIVFTFSAAN